MTPTPMVIIAIITRDDAVDAAVCNVSSAVLNNMRLVVTSKIEIPIVPNVVCMFFNGARTVLIRALTPSAAVANSFSFSERVCSCAYVSSRPDADFLSASRANLKPTKAIIARPIPRAIASEPSPIARIPAPRTTNAAPRAAALPMSFQPNDLIRVLRASAPIGAAIAISISPAPMANKPTPRIKAPAPAMSIPTPRTSSPAPKAIRGMNASRELVAASASNAIPPAAEAAAGPSIARPTANNIIPTPTSKAAAASPNRTAAIIPSPTDAACAAYAATTRMSIAPPMAIKPFII